MPWQCKGSESLKVIPIFTSSCPDTSTEYAALEQTIDQLDSCLDELDQKNDDLNAKLRALLAASQQDYEELTATKHNGGQAEKPDC